MTGAAAGSGPSRLPGFAPWPEAFAARYREQGLWQGSSIGDWFRATARRFHARPAVVDGPHTVTYAELDSRIDALSQAFGGVGIAALDRVVLQLPNGLSAIESLLALIRLGAIPVLALPAHRKVELQAFCARSGASAMVFAARHGRTDLVPIARAIRAETPGLRHLIALGEGGGYEDITALSALGGCKEWENAAPSGAGSVPASEVALLQLSGGSTGIPKLIARTHDDYLYSVRASAELCRLHERTRFLAALPVTHNFTLSSPGVLGTLHAGGAVVICRDPSPEAALGLLERERITVAPAVPSLARAWLESARRRGVRFPELLLQVGGARLDDALALALVRVLGCRLQQVFGMAEGLVNYTRPGDGDDVVFTTQGRPLSPFDEVRIVDPSSRDEIPVEDGSIGELLTRGPYTVRGYYDDRGSDPRHFTADGFYRTGDLVRRTIDGYLVVEGRAGERICRAGEKISPEEVEGHLRALPRVSDAAVIGAPDVHLGERSHAFVALRAAYPGRDDGEATVTLPVLRAELRERGIADFKLPDVLHVVPELPRTSVGKTDRRALRALLENAP